MLLTWLFAAMPTFDYPCFWVYVLFISAFKTMVYAFRAPSAFRASDLYGDIMDHVWLLCRYVLIVVVIKVAFSLVEHGSAFASYAFSQFYLCEEFFVFFTEWACYDKTDSAF